MDEPPTHDAAFHALHAAGWSVGDTAFAGPDGSLVWLVTGHRGGLEIRAGGETRAGAWWEAVKQAEAAKPGDGNRRLS
jgi:hypothetical protein